jgi:hypothetical protein
MLKLLTKRNLLTGEAWRFLLEEDQADFFTTRRNRTHESFENLIYQYNQSKFLLPISVGQPTRYVGSTSAHTKP